MVQVKKAEVRNAIVSGAYDLFREKGYNASSITLLGRRAGIAPSNIYAYFGSKLELFFAVYEPWMREQFDSLERRLAGVADRRERLIKILEFLWIDLPTQDNGFANNLIQAVSTASSKDRYSGDLLQWCEASVSRLMQDDGSKQDQAEQDQLSHVLMMAFDGFAIRHHLKAARKDMSDLIESIARRILDGSGASPDSRSA